MVRNEDWLSGDNLFCFIEVTSDDFIIFGKATVKKISNLETMEIIRDTYTLRPWRPQDAQWLATNANNINIWNNIRDYFPHPYTMDDAEDFIARCQRKPYAQDYAIVVEGNACGGIGFVPNRDIERFSAEIGYWLGEQYWGLGIMTSALRDAVDIIFSTTDIIRLYTAVLEYNKSSMKVLEKAGFRKVGTLERSAVKNGAVIDMEYYELVK